MEWTHPRTREQLEGMLADREVAIDTLAELNRFGDVLLSEVQSRWSGIETKAQLAMGFSIAVTAFVASQAAALVQYPQPWRGLLATGVFTVALLSLIAAMTSFLALRIRSVNTIGAKSWVCEPHLDEGQARNMAEFHLLEQFETYLALNEACREKAGHFKTAEASLVTAGVAVLVVAALTISLAWAGVPAA